MPTRTFDRGDRHEIFHLAIEAFISWIPGRAEPSIDYDGDTVSLADACRLVWNCGDIVPGSYSDDLIEHVNAKQRTYAAFARAISTQLAE